MNRIDLTISRAADWLRSVADDLDGLCRRRARRQKVSFDPETHLAIRVHGSDHDIGRTYVSLAGPVYCVFHDAWQIVPHGVAEILSEAGREFDRALTPTELTESVAHSAQCSL